jgi:integrase/recombinase XerD
MNSEIGAAGKGTAPSDSAPGQGTPVSGELVPLTGSLEPATGTDVSLFPIVRRAGKAAVFAAGEFFFGTIRNAHTRRAYLYAVRQFLQWAEAKGLELAGIAPRDVGQYLDSLGSTTGIATRKQHLSALRHFFDGMVTRHAIILNPALSVRAERYSVIEGRTPEISVARARTLLASIRQVRGCGRRDRRRLRDARRTRQNRRHLFARRSGGCPRS